MRTTKFFFLLLIVAGCSFLFFQNAYAVTVYPGTIISNPKTNYTADVSPNFNVTQFNVTATHIFFGNKFYDLNSTIGQVNANITKFNEDQNMTIKIIGSPGAVKWYVYGQVAQVKIGGVTQTYGTTWQYINGNTATRINIGSSTDVFISFSSGSLSVRNLYLTGAIFGATAQFNQPTIFINSPSLSNVTEIGLYNTAGLLYDHVFTTPVSITSGSNVTIPYKFNDTNTGLQTYQLAAVVQSHSNYTIVFSNNLSLYFGSFTPGKLTLNYTNPLSVSFRFVKNDINSTATNLDVYYPSTFNSTCSMLYQQEQTNKTYSGLPASHATFTFLGLGNDSVQVDCKDTITNATGTYVLTQSNFPLLQQIKDFREGKFGTSGKFGAFDLVSLIALIVSILGFNRVNESVGAIFNIFLIGFLAFFGIIAWPVILSSSVALVLVLVISSTRKTQFG